MKVPLYQNEDAFYCTSSLILDACPSPYPSPQRGEGRVRGAQLLNVLLRHDASVVRHKFIVILEHALSPELNH
jgi:hypothetical protein